VTCEHGAAALTAHAGLDVAVREERAGGGEGVDVGGTDCWVLRACWGKGGLGAAEGVVAELVGHED